MTRQQALDLYFLEARAKLIGHCRVSGPCPPGRRSGRFSSKRIPASSPPAPFVEQNRAEQVLRAFSDPTSEPLAAATTKGACGAWPGKS